LSLLIITSLSVKEMKPWTAEIQETQAIPPERRIADCPMAENFPEPATIKIERKEGPAHCSRAFLLIETKPFRMNE
jgi:hypothetical protein